MTHIRNRWSNEEKAKEVLLKVITPYVQKTRKNLQLHNDKEWLLIPDVFRGQCINEVKNIIEENNGKVVPVPNSMTGIIESLDLTVNRCCKGLLRNMKSKQTSALVF